MTSIAEPTWLEPIEAWSRDWRDALPKRTPEDTERLLAETRAVVAALQAAAKGDGPPRHALHPRGIFATTRARLDVAWWLPPALSVGPLRPSAKWPALVRLSSASPKVQPDDAPDQRGLAVRVAEGVHRLDLLATTGAAHHARDAEAMLASLRAAAVAAGGGLTGQLGAVTTLVRALGVGDGLRLAKTVSGARLGGKGLPELTFDSRAPFALGPWAVRFRFAPVPDVPAGLGGRGADVLLDDLLARLAGGPVHWSLQLQGFLDPVRTPLDDHRVAWDSPWVPIGFLQLEAGERDKAAVRAETDALSATSFVVTPAWPDPTGPVFEPVGDLNLIRAAAYRASEQGRRHT